ncbi:hypothetical protein D3C75_1083380 [compost metagenome]
MLVRGDAKSDDLAKADGAQRQDVGDGEAISCHIGHLGKAGIEPGKPGQGLLLALLPHCALLRQKHPDPAGVGGTVQLIDRHLASVVGNTEGRFPFP